MVWLTRCSLRQTVSSARSRGFSRKKSKRGLQMAAHDGSLSALTGSRLLMPLSYTGRGLEPEEQATLDRLDVEVVVGDREPRAQLHLDERPVPAPGLARRDEREPDAKDVLDVTHPQRARERQRLARREHEKEARGHGMRDVKEAFSV